MALPDEFSTPGIMSVGYGARIWRAGGGDRPAGSVGPSFDGDRHSAEAQHHSVALGDHASAIQWATAIGGSAHAMGTGTVAIGSLSFADNLYSTAVGSSAVAQGYYVAGFGSRTFAACAWSGAWGTAETEQSIALGGYTGGFKSFAAHSGVTWAPWSVAIGRGTVTGQNYQVALGTLNVDPTHPPTFEPLAGDAIFIIGNGYPLHGGGAADPLHPDGDTEIRSNAFTVGYDGSVWVRGGLTVENKALVRGDASGIVEVPAPSVFKGDVSVEGTLRIPERGDLSMGPFTATP